MSTTDTFAVVSELLSPPVDPRKDEDPDTRRRTDGCKAARAVLNDAQRDRHLWGLLVLGIGVIFVLTVAYLILQVSDLGANVDKAKAAVAGCGTVASGGLSAWVVARFNDAKKDQEKWAGLVNERCD